MLRSYCDYCDQLEGKVSGLTAETASQQTTNNPLLKCPWKSPLNLLFDSTNSNCRGFPNCIKSPLNYQSVAPAVFMNDRFFFSHHEA